MGQESHHRTVERQILAASYVSIIGNGLLSVAKIVAGLISGSFAVVGDGIDSASDVAVRPRSWDGGPIRNMSMAMPRRSR